LTGQRFIMFSKSLRFERRLGALFTLTVACACSDATSSPPPASGGFGGAGGSPVAAAGAPAGGVNAAGSASNAGANAGNSGAGGMANAGEGGSLGEAGSARGGAGASGGGTGGTPAAGSGGAAGAGGDGLLSIAAELSALRLECPCIDANHFGAEKSDNCDAAAEVDRQTYVRKLGGDPSLTYDVKLRVRGNTEPNTYVGGKLEQERFYVGGQTSTPGYTAYMLTVSEPRQVYFFNHNPTTGHVHFLIDYEVVIPIRGGATATFEVNGGKSVPDGHGVSNRERLVVPGVAPAPDPFNGQLVQFDVVSVTPRAAP
jgi:hypothetical protein